MLDLVYRGDMDGGLVCSGGATHLIASQEKFAPSPVETSLETDIMLPENHHCRVAFAFRTA